jgi:hypothetical protein
MDRKTIVLLKFSCFNKNNMSSEPLNIDIKTRTTNFQNLEQTGRVDINVLLNRVRIEKKRKQKESLVFFSLIVSVIALTGIIASL